MSERNGKMAAMLAADAPAARDLAFEIAVLARIEQRRFVRGVARNFTVAAGAALLLAFIIPQLDPAGWSTALLPLTGNGPVMGALLAALFAAWYFRPAEA